MLRSDLVEPLVYQWFAGIDRIDGLRCIQRDTAAGLIGLRVDGTVGALGYIDRVSNQTDRVLECDGEFLVGGFYTAMGTTSISL